MVKNIKKIKRIIMALVLVSVTASASSAGSLILQSSVSDVTVTVRSAGNTWRGHIGDNEIFKVNNVPAGKEFEVTWDRGDIDPITTRGMHFPAGGADLYVSIEYGIVRKGEYYTVRIPANHTTGYEWEILGQDLAGSLIYMDRTYETSETRPSSSLRAGTEGMEKWMFKATGLGRTQVLFGYRRSWEKLITPCKYHICTVLSKMVHK